MFRLSYKKTPSLFLNRGFGNKEIQPDWSRQIQNEPFVKSFLNNLWLDLEISYKIFTSDKNRYKFFDMSILLLFLFLIKGNPFVAKYIGVAEIYENNDRSNSVSDGKKILYEKHKFSSNEANGYFDNFEDYRTQKFIFKETGYLKGFYFPGEKPNSSFKNFLNVMRLTGLGIITSLIESIIKSILWVGLIYISIGIPITIKLMRAEKAKLQWR